MCALGAAIVTVDQKRTRMDISAQCFAIDRLWTKQQSKQWTKAKTVLSIGKVMATGLWDSQGIILIDCLEKGEKITGAYYTTLLDRFKEELKQKWPRLAHKKVLFHQDNATFHKSTFDLN
jgi:hypothetical protein